ncbi:DUF1351 domain-containing protein [Porcipelethomonas sp.]|uniref:DUF1351 domain-containing protein n=1 Tax=Porcipelethomonas sp. TaxID=2981675 RepID=UPI003079F43B
MDFKLQTDLNTLPSVIEFNYSELKAEMTERLKYYNNLVVSENSIKSAKADKANLNKLIAVIESERKEVKRRCLEPYNDFEAKCKELVMLVKAPVVAIDNQIKEFENIKKQEKYDELKFCFDNYIGDMADIIKFDKILNPKWGNATLKIDTLKAEIEDNIDRIKKELETLNTEYADKPYKSAVISEYCKEYSTSQALVYAAQLQREEEMQRKVLEQTKTQPVQQEVVQTVSAAQFQQPKEQLGTCAFRVIGTYNQIKNLRKFMVDNGIKFETIKTEGN